MNSCAQALPIIKLHFMPRLKAQFQLQFKPRTIFALQQLSSIISFSHAHGNVNAHNYSTGSVVLHWKYVAMESTARERAATTRHHDTSSPQLLLIFSGSPLPSTQRLKMDLKLKWSICNTSFLPIPPQGTETFHKNPTKHPTYALTSPCRFLTPRCTHALKRKFLPAPFSFYALRLGSRFPSGATLLLVPRGAVQSLLLFSHSIKQIPRIGLPCCSADWEGSNFCHLNMTLGKVIQQQQTDLQIQCRENLSVLLKSSLHSVQNAWTGSWRMLSISWSHWLDETWERSAKVM